MSDQRIYKYALTPTDRLTLLLPEGAAPLCVQTQNGEPWLWALVDAAQPLAPMAFVIHGTGHPVLPGCGAHNYLGTFQLHGGALVFHVFGPFAPVEEPPDATQ